MNKRGITEQRLVALFLLGCALLNYPLLSLFNVEAMPFGLPALLAYVFLAWIGLVLLMALVIERSD